MEADKNCVCVVYNDGDIYFVSVSLCPKQIYDLNVDRWIVKSLLYLRDQDSK